MQTNFYEFRVEFRKISCEKFHCQMIIILTNIFEKNKRKIPISKIQRRENSRGN